MENAKPRAPLELSLVEMDPVPEAAANADAAEEPVSLETVTLQPYNDRRPTPAPVPPRAPSLDALMLAPLDAPSASAASSAVAPTTSQPQLASEMAVPPPSAPAGLSLAATSPLAATTTSGSSGTQGADRFVEAAAREYAAGRIDQPLWMRAAAQSGGDEAVARDTYLRARATALKLAQRERRGDTAARTGSPAMVSGGATAGIGANLAGSAITGNGRSSAPSKTRLYIAAAATAVVVGSLGTWWWLGGDPPPAPVAAVPARPAAPVVAKAAPAAPAAPTPEDHAQYFGTKVAELKNAGNWNVLVLYASEWTRKQPDSATAWKELAIGYGNMRQHDDALQAATKATQLAPKDPAAWRMLGQAHVALDQPAPALLAFEQATTLDDGDLPSWVQAGTLRTQLDRLPEARAAFDRVLTANPDDVGALCGKAALAQRQKLAKEAETIARQLKALDAHCPEAAPAAVVVAPAAPAAPAPYKPVAARTR